MNVGLILALACVILVLIGAPIVVALGLGVTAAIYASSTLDLSTMVQQTFAGVNSYVLMAIPLFMIAGELMSESGLIDDLLTAAKLLVGKVPGGLACTNIVGSMLFAGISGSAVADTAAIGGALIPAMVKEGYDDDFSVAVTASSSVIGPIIPPSIPMVLYGSQMGVSIGAMFAAGALPGVVAGLALLVPAIYTSYKRNYPRYTSKITLSLILKTLRKTLPAILMPVIVVGGLLGAIFSPTEASAICVLYSLLVGVFYYKTLTLKKILICVKNGTILAATILGLVGISTPIGTILALERVPAAITALITSISTHPTVVLLMITVLLLLLGCLLDGSVIILIFAPILAPVATGLGVSSLQFAVLFVVTVMIGVCTPPFGLCLYVTSGIAKISFEKASKAIIPYVIALVVVVLMIALIPEFSLLIPKALGYVFT